MNYIKRPTGATTNIGARIRGRIQLGVTAPAAQVHIDQDDNSAAIPALFIDQADESEECIKFSSNSSDNELYQTK